MQSDVKKRLRTLLLRGGITVAILLLYYLFTRLTGLGIPCPLHALTGLHCPGCGISRMCIALLSGDFTGAVRANLLAMLILPVAAVLVTRRLYHYVRYGRSDLHRVEYVLIAIAVIAAIVFAVLRNTEAFAFLAPQ